MTNEELKSTKNLNFSEPIADTIGSPKQTVYKKKYRALLYNWYLNNQNVFRKTYGEYSKIKEHI